MVQLLSQHISLTLTEPIFYKATITEFLRQIVSNAYAGNQLTEEETQAKLASILNEQAKKVEKNVSPKQISPIR